MSTVVIDPRGWLPVRLDREVAYGRNSIEGLALLQQRRASGTHTDTLWLSWDLSTDPTKVGDDSSSVIAALTQAARAGRPYPIGRVIVHTNNSERGNQMHSALEPWYDVDAIAPAWSALYTRGRPKPRPATNLAPVERLRRAGVQIEPGLSDVEIEKIQRRLGVTFCAPHRAFLQEGLPVNTAPGRRGWPNWREGDPDELDAWIQQVTDDIAAYGAPRRREPNQRLIPLYNYRLLPAGSDIERSPVFSWCGGDDVIHFAADIAAWIGSDFEGDARSAACPAPEDRIPFWSDLADSTELWASNWDGAPKYIGNFGVPSG